MGNIPDIGSGSKTLLFATLPQGKLQNMKLLWHKLVLVVSPQRILAASWNKYETAFLLLTDTAH